MGSRLCLHIPESCSGLNSATDCRTAGRSWWQQPEKGVRSRSGIQAPAGGPLPAERECKSAQEKEQAMPAKEDTVQENRAMAAPLVKDTAHSRNQENHG